MSARASNGAVDEVLAKWLPLEVLRGRQPLDAAGATAGLSAKTLKELILDFDVLLRQVVTPRRDINSWDLPELPQGHTAGYVADGPALSRRLVHASLYVDRVLVAPPVLPRWGLTSLTTAEVLRLVTNGEHQAILNDLKPTGPPGTYPDDPIELADYLVWEFEHDSAEAVKALEPRLPALAANLLGYWSELRRPLAEGWLNVVDRHTVATDNIKDICRDPEFREEVEAWDREAGSSFESWAELLTATGLAHALGREHVVSFPGRPKTVGLISLTSRFYTTLPYGLVAIGRYLPTRRLVLAGGGELERGHWFDEILLGLGDAVRHLDMQACCELRREGLAADLSGWLTGDLNRVALAAMRGEDVVAVVAQARHRLATIAAAADARISRSDSALLKQRLAQAGIGGASGLVAGVLGTVLTGGALPVAAVVGALGFALNAVAGAVGATPPGVVTPDPVMFNVLRHVPSTATASGAGQ